MSSEVLFNVGLLLVLAGFALAFLSVVTAGVSGRTRAGGLILIGHIPIAFGTDRRIMKLLVACTVALLAFVFAFTVLAGR